MYPLFSLHEHRRLKDIYPITHVQTHPNITTFLALCPTWMGYISTTSHKNLDPLHDRPNVVSYQTSTTPSPRIAIEQNTSDLQKRGW